ncbi:MAG: tryptophan synthase subunit alpha [Thiomicrospira sp.]|jgi:tryptophan synthase alpha chain|nr:tryptophan synthase subunit alpha [Thiomicrospira sp.]
MSRIQTRLAELKAQGKTALIPYLTAGDPQPQVTVTLMHDLVAAGADIVELGVPFSDPMADGPVIQRAVERALAHHVSLLDVLAMVSEFRRQDKTTPVVLMGYLNPIEAMGRVAFAERAKQAGVDGVLTVDMPPQEAQSYVSAMKAQGLDCIFLVSPTTPTSRLAAVNEYGSGFVYYVSLKGVTGSAELNEVAVSAQLQALVQHLNLPIGIGFGIRNAQNAYQMARIGDGVIIGSALVSLIEAHAAEGLNAVKQALIEQMAEFRHAIDQADKGESL